MATLKDITSATRDDDLLSRLIAAATEAGIPNPQTWAEQNRPALVVADINGTNLATVLAYAKTEYKGRPGENPAWITDEQIRAAVSKIQG